MDLKSPFILNKLYSTVINTPKLLLFLKTVFTLLNGKSGFWVHWCVLAIAFLLAGQIGYAAERYAVTNGNWNGAIWAATSGGAAGSASTPTSADNVYINDNRNVTVNTTAACLNLRILGGGNTSYITINGSNTLTVGNAITINAGTGFGDNKYISVVAGTLTANSVTIDDSGGDTRDSYISVSTGIINVSGNITMNGTANRNQLAFSGAGTINVGGTITGGTISNNSGSYVALTRGTVNYNNNGDQTIRAFTYYNLSVSGGGTKSLGGATTVSGIFTLNDGVISTTTTNLLSVTNTATTAISGGSASSYIDGPVRWSLPTMAGGGSTYNFPVGDAGGYKPFSLVNPITSGAVTAQVEAVAANSNGISADGLELSTAEYWKLTRGGNPLSNTSISLGRGTAIFPLNSTASSTTVNGTYTTRGGTADTYIVSNSNAVPLSSTDTYFVLGKANPLIISSTTALSGFTYAENNGPSVAQTFTVSGAYHTSNITVAVPANSKYELSTDESNYSGNVNVLINAGGTASTTTIYVRLKAGLSVGTYNDANDKITASATDATSKFVSLSGNVTNQPLITVTPNTLSGFGYVLGNGPSTPAQTFVVNGSNLQTNVTVIAPASFEISQTSATTGFTSGTLTLTQSGGIITNKTVWVRLIAGLSTSTYNEDVTLTANYATTKTVNCQGTVNRATINVSKFTLAGFIYTQGAGPSGIQTFNVSGTTLSANIVITAPTHFEIATSSGGTYGANINLTPLSGTITSTTIYVRMKSGYTAQTITPENITLTTTNAIQQNVACSGVVVTGAATISSNPILNGFFYIVAKGPSIAQSFTVSGTSLGANVITVTAPTNFEVSSSGTDGTYGASFTITPSGGKVNASPVYIRLKSGLAINTYTGNLTLAATGATTVNVACNGKVVAQPTVVASPDPYNVCAGNSATLSGSGTNITSYFWIGPNGFSSNSQNPSLGTVTATNSGEYVVTGAVGSGVNLLTNGDFESGNSGFGTTYDFNNVLGLTYGAYWINANPWNVNNTYFISASDHTPGSGTLQMVVDGAETAGAIIWSQTVSVSPNTAYQFSYWGENINSQGNTNYAKLQVYVNNVPTGAINTLSTTSWGQYSVNVNSGASSSLQLTLINSFIGGSGNDFAIDDLNFEQVFEVKDTLTLTVNPLVTAAVNITASQNPSLSGATVTYTATPTNGGVNPTYEWFVGGVSVASGTSSTYSITNPTSGTTVYCRMTSTIPCTNVVQSNTITQTVNPPTNYWHGNISTDWNNASNWTAGYVPVPGADVIFTSTSNAYGLDAINNLVLDKDRTQGSIINASTKSLIIPAGKTLTVNNTITSGTNAEKIQIQADATNPNGSLIFYSNNTVYATVEMYSKAYINSASTAINSKYKWQYFGIPVQSITTAESTFFGSYVRKWIETGKDSTTHWVSLNNQSTLEAFKGYEITQPNPKKIYFQGILNNQDYTTPTLSYTSSVDFPGQHVLANSYTAALDIGRINFGSSLDQTIYLYNTGSMRDWYSQSLVTNDDAINPGQYVGVTPALAGQSGLPDRIPSMQGFVVKTASADANSYINLSYQNSIVKNTTAMRVKYSEENSSDNKLYSSTVVSLKTKNTLDKLWLFTIPEATNGFDAGYDVPKLMGSSIESELHSVGGDTYYQINSSPNIHNSLIAVRFATDTIYTLHFEHFNQSEIYSNIYLFDAEENKVIDITSGGSEYSFFAKSSSSAVPRFRIITNNDALGTDKDSNIKIFSTGGTVFVKNNSSNSGNIQLFDMSGRLVRKLKMDTDGTITAINGLKKGYYVVSASTDTEKNSKQVIVF